MYKIVAAVNSMVENAHQIGSATKEGNIIFFVFKGQFKWSLNKTNDDYELAFYPGEGSIENIKEGIELSYISGNYELPVSISYSTSELKTPEAFESFAELYQVVQGKLYNIDAVLDSIINMAA